MSDSCEVSSPSVFHSVGTPGSKLYLHVHVDPSDDAVENKTHDHRVMYFSDQSRYFAVKSAVDRAITGVLMIVALPLMAVIALAILLLDGRPILYRQKRVGKNGRVFRIWKFRTMCQNAESETGAVWSSASDPRVTALGRWLRCSHLDELPQFFNVLVGHMNLIGPRPERPEFVRELVRELPCYRERLTVRPGITGLAQLRLGYDQSVADVGSKLVLDGEYIRTATLSTDIRILLVTIPYIALNLLRKWKNGPQTLDDSTQSQTVRPFDRAESIVVRRSEAAKNSDAEPHVVRFPDVAINYGENSFCAHPTPLFVTVDGGVRGADECR